MRTLASVAGPRSRNTLPLWLLVCIAAWESLGWFFGEFVSLSFAIVLWVVLPLIFLAFSASLLRWCLACNKILSRVNPPGIDRVSRFFWPLDTGASSNPIGRTFPFSTSHLVLPTASFPTQETLVTAVGLTSVARRLQ